MRDGARLGGIGKEVGRSVGEVGRGRHARGVTNMVYFGVVGWCEQITKLEIRKSRTCARYGVVVGAWISDSSNTHGVISRSVCWYDLLRCASLTCRLLRGNVGCWYSDSIHGGPASPPRGVSISLILLNPSSFRSGFSHTRFDRSGEVRFSGRFLSVDGEYIFFLVNFSCLGLFWIRSQKDAYPFGHFARRRPGPAPPTRSSRRACWCHSGSCSRSSGSCFRKIEVKDFISKSKLPQRTRRRDSTLYKHSGRIRLGSVCTVSRTARRPKPRNGRCFFTRTNRSW